MRGVINRIDAIKDDNAGSPGDSLAEYSYFGSETIVIEDFPEPDVKLNYASGAAGAYAGFDRFGRVVDQLWYDYGASADRDRYTYGYDRAGNRLYRENTISSAMDEFYSYDGANRLATFDRGDLNAGKTAITGTPVREENLTLDPTGNWTDYVQKTSGSTDLNQDRAHNKVNEITDITETVGTAWVTPVEDKNGNMTTVPKPSSLANGLTLEYDAWNRLTEVKDGATVVGKYEYDGLNRRVKRHLDSQSPASPNGLDTYVHYFYNARWQILETRVTTTESDQPENLQPKYQHVWSPRYIDSPILRDENTDQDSLCDDQRLYYLNDANFNVTSLIDTAGDAVEHYLYNPYGKVTIYDGSWSSTRSTSSYSNAILYTGRELDPESGIMHYRWRFYSTELGRFVSRDPIGYDAGSNLYQFLNDSPLGSLDPFGTETASPQAALTEGERNACCQKSGGTLTEEEKKTTRAWVTCCKGQKISCVNKGLLPPPPKPRPGISPVAADVFAQTLIDCAVKHEDSHHGQTVSCDDPRWDQKCLPFKDPKKTREHECNAYEVEINCLWGSIATLPRGMDPQQWRLYFDLIKRKAKEYADFANGLYKCDPPVDPRNPRRRRSP